MVLWRNKRLHSPSFHSKTTVSGSSYDHPVRGSGIHYQCYVFEIMNSNNKIHTPLNMVKPSMQKKTWDPCLKTGSRKSELCEDTWLKNGIFQPRALEERSWKLFKYGPQHLIKIDYYIIAPLFLVKRHCNWLAYPMPKLLKYTRHLISLVRYTLKGARELQDETLQMFYKRNTK